MRIHLTGTKRFSETSRSDVTHVFEAGLKAVQTAKAIQDQVKLVGNTLRIGRRTFVLDRYDNVFVIGIGKASFEAGRTLECILGSWLTDGIVLDVKGGNLKRIKSLVGTHPFPSFENVRATGAILGILKGADSHDLILAIISGGGSALLCWPYKLECDEVTNITRTLMHQGASIDEMNTVRKHLSEIQGGQMARMAYPAQLVGLIFSDVPGDDIGMVASGPTIIDSTTVSDASRILQKYNVLSACKLPVCELIETPKNPKFFSHVYNHLVMNNVVALKAMCKEARRLGYKPILYSSTLTGEARDVGTLLAGLPRAGEMVIAGGETTVSVKGKGHGGRNQEVALGALAHLTSGVTVASLASDGVDNGPLAGALVNEHLRDVAIRKRLESEDFLARNDSSSFFKAVGGAFTTGITGINVSDLMIALRTKK